MAIFLHFFLRRRYSAVGKGDETKMRRRLFNIAGAGLLAISLGAGMAAAQYNDDDTWHKTRDGFYAGTDWHMRLFDRVREDLDHVQAHVFTSGDEYRIDRTKQQIGDLQGKMTAGQYDERELDEVIGGLGRVVADNRLSARDRDILSDDLRRLRDYREHHDNWH